MMGPAQVPDFLKDMTKRSVQKNTRDQQSNTPRPMPPNASSAARISSCCSTNGAKRRRQSGRNADADVWRQHRFTLDVSGHAWVSCARGRVGSDPTHTESLTVMLTTFHGSLFLTAALLLGASALRLQAQTPPLPRGLEAGPGARPQPLLQPPSRASSKSLSGPLSKSLSQLPSSLRRSVLSERERQQAAEVAAGGQPGADGGGGAASAPRLPVPATLPQVLRHVNAEFARLRLPWSVRVALEEVEDHRDAGRWYARHLYQAVPSPFDLDAALQAGSLRRLLEGLDNLQWRLSPPDEDGCMVLRYCGMVCLVPIDETAALREKLNPPVFLP